MRRRGPGQVSERSGLMSFIIASENGLRSGTRHSSDQFMTALGIMHWAVGTKSTKKRQVQGSHLNLSLPSSKSTFSKPIKEKCMSEVAGIASIIVFHLSKLWRATFSILCDVISLMRLQGEFECDRAASSLVWPLSRLNWSTLQPHQKYNYTFAQYEEVGFP